MPTMTSHPVLRQSPIRRAKLHELVSQKLEEMIRSGELKPGDQLPSERAIMTAFNIGRPAVREAFLSLENKGIIVTESGRRASVRLPSVSNVFSTLDSVVGLMIREAQSLKNLYDARVFIEAAMARHAAQTIDPARLADLKAALEANKRASGDGHLFMQTDIAFHSILFQTAGNPIFDAVHAALVNWLMERWRKIDRTDAVRAVAYKGHLQIFRAVERRDPDAAEGAMRNHLRASWGIWSKQQTE
jgi:GntR family transcriptional regulator, sialic acid-inducible nan operon repressor